MISKKGFLMFENKFRLTKYYDPKYNECKV